MSCDHSRTRFLGLLASRVAPIVGSEGAARDFLDTLFDLTANQSVPDDRASKLAGEARTRQMMRYAQSYNIDLYPHPSSDGLPAPEAQQGWRVVAEVLEAVEKGGPLPETARDAQQVFAFRGVVERSYSGWGTAISGAGLTTLRRAWAADPERIALLCRAPRTLGEDGHVAWLGQVTTQVADDPRLSPDVAAAARQYLLLDEAGMLEPHERAGWARVLAWVAGVGIGKGSEAERRVCSSCGFWMPYSANHACDATDTEIANAVAMAVGELLADPLYSGFTPDPSPFVTAERMLEGWMQTGQPDPPTGAEGRLLDALRAADRRMLQELQRRSGWGRISRAYIDRRRLRDATIRTPLLLDGIPHIWEADFLFQADTYRRRAHWEDRLDTERLFPNSFHEAEMVAVLDDEPLVRLMLGQEVEPYAVKWPRSVMPQRYEHVLTRQGRLKKDDLVYHPECGCLYVCKERATAGKFGALQRVDGPARGCTTHHDSYTIYHDDTARVRRVDLGKPTFTVPTWPGTTSSPDPSIAPPGGS